MNKHLLVLIFSFIFGSINAQTDLKITYDANQGVSGLAGASKVYMYSGAVTSSPTGQWEWTIGSTNQDDGIGLMSSLEITFGPYALILYLIIVQVLQGRFLPEPQYLQLIYFSEMLMELYSDTISRAVISFWI
ncbi:MAG: hypothetical protein IPP71_14320 [Bacteroidetes bacterium]|nr:hypothetical protein [Bacteroidota bacterium]